MSADGGLVNYRIMILLIAQLNDNMISQKASFYHDTTVWGQIGDLFRTGCKLARTSRFEISMYMFSRFSTCVFNRLSTCRRVGVADM